eukprot:CAMPEP_0206570944 /NCGR_PEP_ID=MMETSP0325_2-20121206/27338_1 /ASSEMBLY_ACC=CAM_ASM_000347 /TAXON_ID=2866 /ORGANISM="Crypthecodinium cohnii, Strain Seligo" /LENGTH=243 /DNA_ID=CAMNT_0054074827 /DNA_START=77 /DNA_END=809 /DNA_ORIENTATION=+
MTEALFGIKGKDFVIIAADAQTAFSVIKLKDDYNKINPPYFPFPPHGTFPAMTEALFGIKGKDFVIIAADAQTAFSVIKLKDDYDKIWEVEGKLFAASGPTADASNFVEFIEKNIRLHTLRTGLPLTTKAAANFTRNELAQSLRSRGSYQVDMLIGGMDADGPGLYYLDYLSSMEKVNKAAHGYGAMFTFGLMDRYWKPDLELEEAKDIIRKCIKEIEVRFVIDLGKYICKVVDKNGTRLEEL